MKFSLFNKIRDRWLFLFTITTVVIAAPLRAQNYYFQNYNVEQGLVQSQVLDICQDSAGHIWVATLGGISRFDGVNFTSYTKRDGLADNYALSILYDNRGYMWCGTQSGLSRFNGKDFYTFKFSENPVQNLVTKIAIDKTNEIWCIVSGILYKVSGEMKVEKINTGADPSFVFSAITVDRRGRVWVGGNGPVLYCYDKNWKQIAIQWPGNNSPVISDLFTDDDEKVWLGTTGGLYFLEEDKANWFDLDENKRGATTLIHSILRDGSGGLWIGTSQGAYFLSKGIRRYYNASTGMTNDAITSIFSDREGSTWLGSGGGNGMYRHKKDLFTHIGESNGLLNPSIVSLVKDKNDNLWMGTYGAGLARYKLGKIENYQLPSSLHQAQVINSCAVDNQGDLWIGTAGAGLWKYDGKKFTQLPLSITHLPSDNIINIYKDDEGKIWIGAVNGAVVYSDGSWIPIKGINATTSAFIKIGKDSILAGTTAGVKLISENRGARFIADSLLESSDTKCFTLRGKEVWAGTTAYGIIIWDLEKKRLKNITIKDGLASEFIYSLVTGINNSVFAGTGRGIHRIHYDTASQDYRVKVYKQADGLLGLENNQNAVFKDTGNIIWFGTSRGAFLYNPREEIQDVFYPKIILRSIYLFEKPLTDSTYTSGFDDWYRIPVDLRLPYRKNGLTFSYQAVSFLSADRILYQYMIEGLDDEWSIPAYTSSVTFNKLPPGKYVFKVRAIAEDGQVSPNHLRYPFEIITPFHKTAWFQWLVAFFFILCGFLIQYFRTVWKQRRRRFLDELRQEEQNKIRQRTAEDFHDEMGNKLTRISLLTDILKTKLSSEKEEIKKIADQIKENSGQLYSGTKDIIWSLSPASDNLYVVLQRIRDFGSDLFQDTDIDFSFIGLDQQFRDVVLPIDYSRNFIMIAKESLNNILKYSRSSAVSVTVTKLNPDELLVVIKDNGVGFSMEIAKKGHGIDNMQIRARRINANFKLESSQGNGTILSLSIKIPPTKG